MCKLGAAPAPTPKKNPDVALDSVPVPLKRLDRVVRATDNAEQMTDPIRLHVDGLVGDLTASGAIRSPAIERAFRRVERHRFIEGFFDDASDERRYVAVDPDNPSPDALERIYSRRALTTRIRDGLPCSSTSMPALVASMLELLELRPGMKVLEIGSGTGYNAALMAEIVGVHGLVVTVDIEDDVVSQTARLLTKAGYR
jgi:protein-L-isoaspartate(D-aspartate) O-methyltransferase